MDFLRLKSFSVTIGKKTILSNLSFLLQEGEVLALVGPSGEGKTTFIKAMNGLIPYQGKLETLVSYEEFGMSFQRGGLFDSLTVIENLLFPLIEKQKINKKKAEPLAKEILSEVGLLEFERLFPHEMSGGMQKRLGIARALILKPKIYFADDPTAGLDPITSKEIFKLILKMKEKYRMTVVLATSEVELAKKCDQIAFFYQGEIIEVAAPKEMLNSSHPVIHQFFTGSLEGPLT